LLLIFPALGVVAYLIARSAPHVAVATLGSFLRQAQVFEEARAAQDLWAGAIAVGQGMILVLPLLGIAIFVFTFARRLALAFAAAAGRTRGQRLAGALSAVAAAALLLALWSPLPALVASGP